MRSVLLCARVLIGGRAFWCQCCHPHLLDQLSATKQTARHRSVRFVHICLGPCRNPCPSHALCASLCACSDRRPCFLVPMLPSSPSRPAECNKANREAQVRPVRSHLPWSLSKSVPLTCALCFFVRVF